MRLFSLIALTLFYSLSTFAESGSAGNGGDGVFCNWRKPMVLDYYASGFVGGILYGEYSPIVDIYSSTKPLADLALEILDQAYDMTSENMTIQGVGKTEIKSIRKGLKRTLKSIGHYSKWALVDDVAVIKDSLHDDFLPKGCKVLQVAKAIGNDVTVNRNLFNQLDEKQKEVLAIHEAIYLLGRENYGHKNSFLTRNLVRAILRRGASAYDQEIYDAIGKFILNKLPDYAQNIDEDISGSGTFNIWRLNIFDLAGEFVLEDGQDATICEGSIKGVVSSSLDFRLSLDNFSPKMINYVSLIQFWLTRGLLSTNQITELSLGAFDRAFLYEEGSDFKMIGLNRKDQFFSFIPLGNYKCLYKRSLP